MAARQKAREVSAAGSARINIRACAITDCESTMRAMASAAVSKAVRAIDTPSWCRTAPSRIDADASTSRPTTHPSGRTRVQNATIAKDSIHLGFAIAATHQASIAHALYVCLARSV